MLNGTQIREAREQRGISQERLAAALGVKELTVWRWENKPTKGLDYFTARRLAEVLEIEPDDLFHDEDSADPATAGEESPHTNGAPAAAATRSRDAASTGG